ncbi:MAG: hypothetical protein OEO18_11010 [Gammaproteobacteria bacterium]|nr:hypothetical protein [Gammaproteobacteria bacterium]
MRFSLLLPLCLYSGLANALWTGVSMEIGNYDADWVFAGEAREAQISTINFQIEEKTTSELRVGASIGYLDLRLVADTAAQTKKFNGEYIGVYLRLPVRISDSLSLHGQLGFRYNSGNESGTDIRTGIDWTESSLLLGLGLRFASLRIMPFAVYQDIDGDINDDDGTLIFELDEAMSSGVRFDYFVEDSAFIRLEFVSGGRAGGYLTFARQY